MKDQAGWTELEMPLLIDIPGRKPNYAWVMLATPTDAGVYLNAYCYSYKAGGPKRPLGRWDAVQVK